jgi:hypothetical protein
MQHLKFRIFAGILACLITTFSGLYIYFTLDHRDIGLRLGMKISPVFACMTYVALYMYCYRITIYASFSLLSLFFCLLGDLFLELYDPVIESVENGETYRTFYFILGGGFFMFGRLLLMVIFMIKPFTRISLIRQHSNIKIILSHIIFTIPFLVFGVYNWIREPNFISGCTFIYLVVSFGLPASYAYLRIGALNNLEEVKESKVSCYIAFCGINIFNFSDLLLIISMFTNWLPSYTGLISDVFYWLAMYLLTISVIRTSDENSENGIFNINIL